MVFTEEQIASLAPAPSAFNAGKKLSSINNWQRFGQSELAIWGEIKGSGKNPYFTQIDLSSIAYKCSCPSRQFPCKHSIALMILYAHSKKDFPMSEEEPEWVKEWLDKRQQKVVKKDVPTSQTPEQLKKKELNREKTQANRLASVIAGANELELWLKDLVRIGLLELPSKSKKEFDKIAARMVDAKAPGLAGWVKALSVLNYQNGDRWQDQALEVISKLFLLISTIKNYNQLSPIWQTTVKNLSGWGQSSKELLEDDSAQMVNDLWLVLGQETEESNDIITQRNWLVGSKTNTKALILNFGTPFSSLENNILPGTIIEAEMVFFPSIQQHRAVIKLQKSVNNNLTHSPNFHKSWEAAKKSQVDILKINPWANDHICLLRNARLFRQKDEWLICDENNTYLPVVHDVDLSKLMKCLAITGNAPVDIACILRNDEVLPLGVFDNEQYKVL